MTPAWPKGVGRVTYPELDSTNAEALRRAAAGEAGPLWILAGRQTAARGRRGRPWQPTPGHFAATLLMRPPGGPAEAALRSFTAALALREALAESTGAPERFALKWPNDLLLDGKKLAGILLESAFTLQGFALAVGIGVNLLDAPDLGLLEPGALPPVGLAEATGTRLAPEDLLARLAPAFAFWEDRMNTEGFAPIRQAWLTHAARLGQPMTARLPGREIRGRFETVAPDGALVLRTAKGPVRLLAADVHFAGDDIPGGEPGLPPGPDMPPEIPPGPDGPDLPPGPPDEAPPGLPPESPPGPPLEAPGDTPQEIPPAPGPDLPPGPGSPPVMMAHAARH